MQENDFFEGVRSVLIDKDFKPNFKYQFIGDIPQNEIDAYFQEFDDARDELQL